MSDNKNISPIEDFNWEALGKRGVAYSEKEKEEYTNLYEKTLSSLATHEVVNGKVVGLTPKDVLINIGYKSEGVIPRTEFRYNPDLKLGDEVDVYIDSLEDKNGQLNLSHKKARAIQAWDKVQEVHAKDEIITGLIK